MRIQLSLSAIPLSRVRSAMAGFNRQRYASIFNKYGSSSGGQKDKYRIYIPIDSAKLPSAHKAPVVPREIVDYLAQKGMQVADYTVGIATLRDGKRTIRIGKVLADQPRLKKMFDNDSQRSTSKAVPAWVVISRHPYDILGMSFDRGWTSCMSPDGMEGHRLPAEVKHGSLVAYLIKSTDRNINNPISRIAIKPYDKGTDRILIPSKTYGAHNAKFTEIVARFCQWASSSSPAGSYKLVHGIYDDLGLRVIHHKLSLKAVRGLDRTGKEQVALNPGTPAEILTMLAKDRDETIRWVVAGNPGTPVEVLALLARDNSVDVRPAVAKNPSTPAETMALLAKDKNEAVRLAVAGNPNTPIEILALLAGDKNFQVRLAVASNPSTPVEVLALLAKDKKEMIREAVASNPNISREVCAQLSGDEDFDVRGEIALNPSTPVEILTLLAKDESKYVKKGVAENPRTPVEVLTLLAKDLDSSVLWAVASNPRTPVEVLTLLAKGQDKAARWAVANNSGTPVEVLTLLAKDKELSVRSMAMKRIGSS